MTDSLDLKGYEIWLGSHYVASICPWVHGTLLTRVEELLDLAIKGSVTAEEHKAALLEAEREADQAIADLQHEVDALEKRIEEIEKEARA